MMIREFQESDFEKVNEIYSLSKLDELRFEREVFQLLPLKEDEKRLRDLMESEIFVYEDDGILGYGAIYQNVIRSLFVHPLYRGQGVGSALFGYLIAEVRTPTKLYVAKSNFPAKSMYHKYGFTVTGEFEASYNGKSVLANEMVRISE
ncbi:GNAT family N-acetyltransferase [Halomonas sp. HNIBRBA4712]|uniref:GNAT family N-acetyltransferase n=1 Tax=Halomonas sp. HNIBRBA4712 TaxID=3373087 RepID=UPI00374731C8